MGYEQERGAELDLEVLEFGAKRFAQLCVEVGQRFVHQEDARLTHDCPADRDSLHLAAGQTVGLSIEEMFHAHDGRCAGDPFGDLRLSKSARA